MSELLFDTPWWLPAAIAIAGVCLFVAGNNRMDKALKRLGIGGLVLALLLTALSYFVDTDKERVVDRTRNLVDAVEKRDWNRMQSLLDPRASLAHYRNREQIVSGAKKGVEQFGLESATITSLEARQTDTLITVTLDVLSYQQVTAGRPYPSSWQLDWQETADGWSLWTITPLPNQYQNAEQLRANLPNP